MKTKILTDFQICISVPLNGKEIWFFNLFVPWLLYSIFPVRKTRGDGGVYKLIFLRRADVLITFLGGIVRVLEIFE